MKITAKSARGRKTKIYDSMGHRINSAFSYDTKTKEVGLYLTSVNSLGKVGVHTQDVNGKNKTMKVYVIWPGSYAEIDGRQVD